MTKHDRPDGSGLSEGLGPLPEPDMTLPSVAPDSPDGAHFYRASTVRRLLDGERERCASVCSAVAAGLRRDGLRDQALGADDCEANIRLCSGPNVGGEA
jgi:hypothetical protein